MREVGMKELLKMEQGSEVYVEFTGEHWLDRYRNKLWKGKVFKEAGYLKVKCGKGNIRGCWKSDVEKLRFKVYVEK